MKLRKICLHHGLDLGDCIAMSGTIRDLKMAYPDDYLVDVDTRWPDLWLNNPYITPLDTHEAEHISIGYPLIQHAGSHHFTDAFRLDLADKLKITIPWTTMNPSLFLTDEEKARNIVQEHFKYPGRYWVLNAGYKADVVLKIYPFWQEVCDLLKNKIQIIQVGAANDHHPVIDGVWNLVGKTTVREWIQLIYRSDGTIGPLSAQFLCAAAFVKPSVIIAAGKEPSTWQRFNYQRYLDVIGCLPCCRENGCWKAKYEDCSNRVGGIPRCFSMISPEDVAKAVMSYYEGGVL